MKLFLASEAGNPKSINDIDDFIGGIKGKNISYVVTAANGNLGYGSWRRSQTLKEVKSKAGKVEIVEFENHLFDDPFLKITRNDILWVAGGMSGYLLYWMRRVGFDKKIKSILENGKTYIGSSAGSMVTSKTQNLAEIYIGEEELGSSVIPGLGLIDFEIYPHFEDNLADQIKKIWKFETSLYLLKDGEAITFVDGKINVLGEERIIKNA